MTPEEIALEHVLWAAGDGQKPAGILKALGYPRISGGWDTVRLALCVAARRVGTLKRAA